MLCESIIITYLLAASYLNLQTAGHHFDVVTLKMSNLDVSRWFINSSSGGHLQNRRADSNLLSRCGDSRSTVESSDVEDWYQSLSLEWSWVLWIPNRYTIYCVEYIIIINEYYSINYTYVSWVLIVDHCIFLTVPNNDQQIFIMTTS